MVYRRPPRGYAQNEHPLPHNLSFQGTFGLDGTAKVGTYFPLILNDEAMVNPDTVNANPEHGSFAEADHPYCYKNSIIPKMTLNLDFHMSKLAIETDGTREITVNWMPVYTAFLNRLDAEDSKTAVSVEDILELEHETVGKSAYPLWSTTNLVGGSLQELGPNITTALMGLTTDATMESVAFNEGLFWDAMQYYTNGPMLRKVIGRLHKVQLKRDRPYHYYSNTFTNPTVKRILPYTFCGVLMWTIKAGTVGQGLIASETTDIAHINLQGSCRYDEWNSSFDQTSS